MRGRGPRGLRWVQRVTISLKLKRVGLVISAMTSVLTMVHAPSMIRRGVTLIAAALVLLAVGCGRRPATPEPVPPPAPPPPVQNTHVTRNGEEQIELAKPERNADEVAPKKPEQTSACPLDVAAIRRVVDRRDLLNAKLEGINVIDAKGVAAAFVRSDPNVEDFEDYEYRVFLFSVDDQGGVRLVASYFADAMDAARYTYRTDAKVRAFCETRGISVDDLTWLTQYASDPELGILVHRR